MFSNTYHALRERLNSLPIGMPKTESGVEIDILKQLFTLEEAKMALNLTASLETVSEISQRIKASKKHVSSVLCRMGAKGLVYWTGDKESRKYSLMSLYPGIMEFQVMHMGHELAQKTEQYLNIALTKEMVGTDRIQLFRVVPIQKEVPYDLYIYPYEKVSNIIENADVICLTECLCRTRKGILGESCGAPKDVCMGFGDYGKMIIENGAGKRISREKAMEVLDRAESHGLIHCTFNATKDNLYICNCCGCCCAILRSLTQLNIPSAVAKSDFMVEVDLDECIGCGSCMKRCHMKAISLNENNSILDHDRCIGCGLCILACPRKVRSLRRKSPEKSTPAFETPEAALSKLCEERGKKPPRLEHD